VCCWWLDNTIWYTYQIWSWVVRCHVLVAIPWKLCEKRHSLTAQLGCLEVSRVTLLWFSSVDVFVLIENWIWTIVRASVCMCLWHINSYFVFVNNWISVLLKTTLLRKCLLYLLCLWHINSYFFYY
jgi:hypothetical protein